LTDRSFVHGTRGGIWPAAYDHAGNIQVGTGRFEPIAGHLRVEWEYIFWPANEVSPSSWPHERQARVYTRQDKRQPGLFVETFPDYGIGSGLRGMSFLGFSDPYACLAYLARGIGCLRTVSDTPVRSLVTVACDDLRTQGVAVPVDAAIAGGDVVLFEGRTRGVPE
jgi:hypothetical protein